MKMSNLTYPNTGSKWLFSHDYYAGDKRTAGLTDTLNLSGYLVNGSAFEEPYVGCVWHTLLFRRIRVYE